MASFPIQMSNHICEPALQCNPIPGFEEANMFLENGNVLHFKNPKGKLPP